jgi:hypothetical protein
LAEPDGEHGANGKASRRQDGGSFGRYGLRCVRRLVSGHSGLRQSCDSEALNCRSILEELVYSACIRGAQIAAI